MGHDASKVLMGSTGSSDRDISDFDADPASFPAGLAVRRSSTGSLGVASATGQLVGVSLGKSLSDHKKTSVVRAGNKVPLQITNEGDAAELTVGDLTFTAVEVGLAGNDISIELVDGGTAGSEVVTVTDKAISVSMDDGVSTAQEIADAIEASDDASALVTVAIAGGEEATAQSDAAAANLADGTDDFSYAVPGAPVRVDNTTGKGISSSGTLTGALYLSEKLDGVTEDSSTTPVALLDMGGGL